MSTANNTPAAAPSEASITTETPAPAAHPVAASSLPEDQPTGPVRSSKKLSARQREVLRHDKGYGIGGRYE